ncbi:FAD-dependent oxidoreductase [Mucilaginibacter sp. RS28]|uniref:Tryptophan 2-monooxygenase n=1 Tax=Mucilaginibacter straminoryzae TaxID=2932774 RepID=A0A9X1X459_9SPHI|nr:NAD(P)/FAD-dependent oxidoreductase [Mucilaginibacter straminoryzae]MCJ8209338.1 FAD-dependent oxidoreductase [Mucilaginibacter straminoryzae]
MKTSDIIIVGAGAAGLMAARTLAKAGKQVLVLEARDRIGGRAHTIEVAGQAIELGAEFVHGDLPLSLRLLKEAGIETEYARGEMWHYQKGKFTQDEEEIVGWGELMQQLQQLKEDISIQEFLDQYFSGESYAPLRQSVLRFVAGYDSAEPDKASAFALRTEWQQEDNDAQHRIKGGYVKLMNWLRDELLQAGGKLLLNTPVEQVGLSGPDVILTTQNGGQYKASKVILALPLGVLQNNGITFTPDVPEHRHAWNLMGFGAIIKVLLVFKTRFWEQVEGADMSHMLFLFSEEKIPTWWTQVPDQSAVLTGWLGGPEAKKLKDTSEDALLKMALQSLGNMFNMGEQALQAQLLSAHTINWTADPYTLGSYAYETVNGHQHHAVLNNGVDGKLYFAGEYLYEGPSMGTLEAALCSGLDLAERLIAYKNC